MIDFKIDNNNDLWILTTVSKRLKFDGVFPLTVYRLAKLNSSTLKVLESYDFNAWNNTSFTSFDPQSKYLNDSRYIQKIVADSTQSIYSAPTNSSISAVQWASNSAWILQQNTTLSQSEIIFNDFTSNKIENFNRTNSIIPQSISQIYLDASGELWAVNLNSTNQIFKYSKSKTWSSIPSTFNGTTRIIGDNVGVLYVLNINGIERSIYKLVDNKWIKSEAIPLVNTSGNLSLDKAGKIWFQQSDKILKINPCFELNAPKLSAIKADLRKGEKTTLKAEGCSNVRWTINDANFKSTTVLNTSSSIEASPTENTIYKTQCLDSDCSSDFSNSVELNVLELSVNSTNKTKYCSNESIVLGLKSLGKYAQNNEFNVVFENKTKKYATKLGVNTVLIPKNIETGKYWVKIESTLPKIVSIDSVEVQINSTPSLKITAPANAYLFDSLSLNFELVGTPPFKLQLNNGETINATTNSFTRKFVATEPKTYNFVITSYSDANCASTDLGLSVLDVTATVDPKFRHSWVNFFPIPIERDLNFWIYNRPGKQLIVDIHSIDGKHILTKEFPISTYLDKYKLDLTDLASGIYFLKINTGVRSEIKKIVKY